ncbi:MAG: FAD-dependent oxidoreductase, partial [Planctomycetota bacterium]
MSIFNRVHEVIVHGAGHAGFAAVRELRAHGVDALLLDRGPALLWETGWAFADDVTDCAAPAWTAWCDRLTARGACHAGRLDTGAVEAEAAELLQTEAVPVLLYATPLAVEMTDDRLAAITVATKGGLRRLAAKRWIDASDRGELATLCGATEMPTPTRQRVHIVLRGQTWDRELPTSLACSSLPMVNITVETTRWTNERRLAIELPGDHAVDHGLWLPVLQAARTTWGNHLEHAIVTHGSVVPLPRWNAAATPRGLPTNLVLATPATIGGGWKLGERFALGLHAAAIVRDLPAATPALHGELTQPRDVAPLTADIAVIGVGTGGAVAAIAAARTGRRTVACDPMPFAGGIGSGGGIHNYYWGVRGGLQEEIDSRIQAVMPLFGALRQGSGFHPEAKKAVLAMMLREAGVDVRTGFQLATVTRNARRITSCLLAGPGTIHRVEALAWIDGTGDGDLCGLAGAQIQKGRCGDGLLHAYTQSCGRVQLDKDGHPCI